MGGSASFEHLFQPLRLGEMRLKNRLVMPAMATGYATPEGFVTDRNINYFEARARGGTGLIIIDATWVHPRGKVPYPSPGISDDKFLPGLRRLTDAVHSHGAKIAVQIHHAGAVARPEVIRSRPMGPSPVVVWHASTATQSFFATPREMTLADMAEIRELFVAAALRARRAGFDGVEIHAAHGYLFAQFLSRATNHRQDGYGGDVPGRARLLLETVRAIREAVGPDYPVWCRINGCELAWDGNHVVEGSLTLEESKEIARLLEGAGVSALHVSGYGNNPVTVGALPLVHGPFVRLAEAIKQVVGVPVIAVGRLDPKLAEKTVREGKADLVAMGRGLLADPDLPNKLAEGRLEDVDLCILCMHCVDGHRKDIKRGLECQVNIAAGREGEVRISPTPQSRTVMVVGGGPAGMETARIAALRGHRVTLYEKGPALGGQLFNASVPPGQFGLKLLVRYLETQIRKLGVRVELSTEVTAEMVERVRPDAVVLATGAVSLPLEVPGADGENVIDVLDVLSGRRAVGKRAVIVGNGGYVSYQTAELLANRGHEVIVLDAIADLGRDIGPSRRAVALKKLKSQGVRMQGGVRVTSVDGEDVHGLCDGGPVSFEADTVVVALGMRPRRELAEALSGVGELFIAGDCIAPGEIRGAMQDAYDIAEMI